MLASSLSPLECLLAHIEPPFSPYIGLYHRTYSPAFPATHLLSFLSLPSKLSLRRVCSATKAWVASANPPVFSNLKVLFPLTAFSPAELSALHNISPLCQHLAVTVSQYISIPAPTNAIPLPPLPRLQHLSLTAPDHDPFTRLLSFRLALQSANLPLLTRLTITNLSITGILALRWGTLTSFSCDPAGPTGANVWPALQELNIKAVGWWEDEGPEEEKEAYLDHSESTRRSETEARRRKEDWRTCTRVLHDWLHSFAAHGQLRTLRFDWANSEGPNPLLLDEIASSDGKKEWFSAPAIRWAPTAGPTALWLGNVVVSLPDVRRLKDRIPALESLLVRPECLHCDLGGRKVVLRGTVWAELMVRGRGLGVWKEVGDRFLAPSSLFGAAARGSYDERGAAGSMVLPFMLDFSPEDEMDW